MFTRQFMARVRMPLNRPSAFIRKSLLTKIIALNAVCLTLAYASETAHVYDLKETPHGFYGVEPYRYQQSCQESQFLKMTPSKNQNPLGTCVSFAVGACYEYDHPKFRVSEAEFTVLAETKLSKTDGGDCRPGLFLGGALGLAQKMGFVGEERLSYPLYLNYVKRHNPLPSGTPEICTPRNYNKTMSDIGVPLRLSGTDRDISAYRLGGIFRIHHVSIAALTGGLWNSGLSELALSIGRSVPDVTTIAPAVRSPVYADVEAVKSALCEYRPVAAVLPVFAGCWGEGEIRMPSKTSQSLGLHAVVLTGFDDSKEVFRLKNSWGQDWGYRGSALIPYNYVRIFATELVAVGAR